MRRQGHGAGRLAHFLCGPLAKGYVPWRRSVPCSRLTGGGLVCGALDSPEGRSHFALQGSEVEIEETAARMKDDIDRSVEKRDVAANRFAHAPLDAVAVDSFADGLGDGKADTCADRNCQWIGAGGG